MPTLTLLGRPVLADDGDVIVSGRPVQRHCLALLALLAGERRGLARDRIVAYLWPESDSRTARHRLSVALHVVRQRLGEHGILSHGDALALDPGRWQVDTWSFGDDAARGDFAGALARYHGPLLDGFFLRGTPAFEHWLELWRDRLARRHLALLDALAQEAERSGDLDACVALRRELIAREPCSGARTVALMRSLAAAGHADGAIRCSRAYAVMVRDEYGLEPDPAVLACAKSLAAPQHPRERAARDGTG